MSFQALTKNFFKTSKLAFMVKITFFFQQLIFTFFLAKQFLQP